VNTEITKTKDTRSVRGWIFYDAACVACVRGRHRVGRLFESRGFEWLPLQTPGAGARLRVPESAFERRMHLLTAEGRVFDNADALGVLCRSVWWLWPLGMLLRLPGIRGLARRAYDWLARHRYCFGGACRVQPETRGRVGITDWAAAVAVPLSVVYAWAALKGGAS
jgi:predicted DCC family thiol-disulfide oxidoreductase YuxK